jgi:C1A family cysteine protease
MTKSIIASLLIAVSLFGGSITGHSQEVNKPDNKPKIQHHFGYKPDSAGIKHKVSIVNNRKVAFAKIAPSVDLTPLMPPVYDQGQLGSCTGNGCAAVFEYDTYKLSKTWFMPSRLFIYFNERVLEGTVSQDAGAQIHDGITVMKKWGVPNESLWPYNPAVFAKAPPNSAYSEATAHKVIQDYTLDASNGGLQLKQALTSNYPIVFGCTVWNGLENITPQNYILPMPKPNEQPIGGHCMVIVGYNGKGQYIVRNSWGPGYGHNGYLLIPAAYIENPNISSDFWVVDSVNISSR